MRRFVILVCLLLSATTQALELDVISSIANVPIEQLAECLQQNNLTAEDVENLENLLEDKSAAEKEYSASFGCFVTCVFKKSNIIQDNRIQMDSLLALAKRNKFAMSDTMKRKIEDCIDEAEQEEDECKIGLTFSCCVIKKLRK